MSHDTLLTHPETAQRLGMTEEQLTAFVQNGEIAYINVGRGKKRPRRRYTETFKSFWSADAGGKRVYLSRQAIAVLPVRFPDRRLQRNARLATVT